MDLQSKQTHECKIKVSGKALRRAKVLERISGIAGVDAVVEVPTFWIDTEAALALSVILEKYAKESDLTWSVESDALPAKDARRLAKRLRYAAQL
jgi:hypothetical protein